MEKDIESLVAMVSKVHDGIYGVVVGDMLGVPVEFSSRAERDSNPVTGPRDGGPHDQPLGAWSDDTSLTLALADALSTGYSLESISRAFIAWWVQKEYTSHDWVFDIGTQTRLSLNIVLKILESEDYEALELLNLEADANTNGNGSLMRILPLYFYLQTTHKTLEANFEIIWQVSALTHPHIRAALACLVYLVLLDELNQPDATTQSAYNAMQTRMQRFYNTNPEAQAQAEAAHFTRILDQNIAHLEESDIKSGGYVIETLEAAIWCLLTTNSFEEAVLRSINLGDDTDTTGAVTGGLAGFYYGIDTAPAEWLKAISEKDLINKICYKLNEKNR
jgi:ADP-ribosylglycohydrolase